MTRVWIDGLVFESATQFGIWRIFYECLRRSAEHADFTLWLRGKPSQPIPSGVRIHRDRARTYASRWDVAARLWRKWCNVAPPPRELKDFDVYHSSYFTPCPTEGPAVVVSVYDMVAERMYPYAGGSPTSGPVKRAALEQASLCIAISQATADDLVRFHPELAGRVRVVSLGSEHLTHDGGIVDLPQDRDSSSYALFVGDRHGYKNFIVVLEAMTQPAWPKKLLLHVIGPPLAEHEQKLIDVLGLRERVRSFGRVPEGQLRAQYAAAQCLIFSSLLEGFGIPVLEAQANGCPVVLSDIPVFREVGGEAAIFFDPRLGERLAEAVAAAGEPEIRRKLVEGGADNVRRFSWDRTAQETLAVYEEAVGLRQH